MNATPPRWTAERAAAWMADAGFLAGPNYCPAYASNQLELWQAQTFDAEAIARELGWSAELGFNAIRLYFHDALWAEPGPFLDRVRNVLDLASASGHRVIPTFFDDVWAPEFAAGPQPEPIPGVHNSRWLQSPAEAVRRRWSDADQERLHDYVSGTIAGLADHPAIVIWDLYNEPGNGINTGIGNEAAARLAEPLLEAVFAWARAVDPPQPLTAGPWIMDPTLTPLYRRMIALSDVLSFHFYADVAKLDEMLAWATCGGPETAPIADNDGRPLICTEYMRRGGGVRNGFADLLPELKRRGIGALHWGLVDGRTQTKFPWRSPAGAPEPDPWHHEVLHADGSPYDADEAVFLRGTLKR